jgi:Flp pilus assembly protein TadD
MTSPGNTEIKGTLQDAPLAELLAETSQARLSGSFRLAYDDQKAIIYLQNGRVVFAVTNRREHRLFEILLRQNLITKEKLTEKGDFTNDLALAQSLLAENILTTEALGRLFAHQIREIVKAILAWTTGTWDFSHLARAKENLQAEVEISDLLLEYARGFTAEKIIRRFKSFEERFCLRETFSTELNLHPQEGYIYSRLSDKPMKIQEVRQVSGISDAETLKTLYVLWIGGLIDRKQWNSVFSDSRLEQMLSVKLVLKKEAAEIGNVKNAASESTSKPLEPVATNSEPPPVELDETALLERYLDRVENAESYYEILDIPVKAPAAEIKAVYFQLAKKYHPDKFHQATDVSLQQRVQNAFTEIARAYETLKDESTREVYNFKLRKYLESVEHQKRVAGGKTAPLTNADKAREEFDQGFEYLMQEEYEEAAPFLARAVQFAPENARYRAYLGKLLSYSENHRFKAEAEIRTAMKLDPGNVSYWIMLAEFYIQFNLFKRAEGELHRLLAQFPNNREAEALLDTILNK